MVERRSIFVVAGALINPQGQILLAQRAQGAMKDLWEFPGGKKEKGESPKATLVRELHEELGVEVGESALSPLIFVDYSYPDFDLFMPVYQLYDWGGDPKPLDHKALAWVEAKDLHLFAMPAADIPIIEALTLLLNRSP